MSSKKELVEYCLKLSVFQLRRLGFFGGYRHSGIFSWKNAYEEELGKVLVTVSIGDERWPIDRIEFQYTHSDYWSGGSMSMDYSADIVSTPCRYGGHRYWFLCPIYRNGRACRRRVAVLYKPPGSRFFGCRTCFDLTYKSSQESHMYDSLARSLGLRNSTELNHVLGL